MKWSIETLPFPIPEPEIWEKVDLLFHWRPLISQDGPNESHLRENPWDPRKKSGQDFGMDIIPLGHRT